MRFFFSLVVPALLTVAHVASAAEYDSFNPPLSDIVVKRDVAPASHARSHVLRPYVDAAEEPSAQRRGKPKKAFAAKTSPVAPISGKLAVRAAGAGAFLGYLGPEEKNIFGEYGITQDKTQAVVVSFSPSISAAAPGNLVLSKSGLYPNLGAIVGFGNRDPINDLEKGSANYLFIGDVSTTKPFSSAQPLGNSFTTATGIQRSVESAIWSYNWATKVLTPTWINDDLAPAKPSFLVYVASAPNALAITGDIDKFTSVFGPNVGPLEIYLV